VRELTSDFFLASALFLPSPLVAGSCFSGALGAAATGLGETSGLTLASLPGHGHEKSSPDQIKQHHFAVMEQGTLTGIKAQRSAGV
jgi:hypothetical protein